jgi:hypothetical protein
MLIAVKEGVTVFRGGTIFEVEDSKEYQRSDGRIEECLQLPDDGMGRPLLIETKDVLLCGEETLVRAEQGQGRCYFSKEEIVRSGNDNYGHDFTPRSITFDKNEHGWRMMWRIPPNANLDKRCTLFNKVTKGTWSIEAECMEIEYDEVSISAIDYKQTTRKRKAPHHVWNINAVKPGFYVGEVDLGDGFKGRIHFIKHFSIQLSDKDPRETSDLIEPSFSGDLWNHALKLKLAWGPKSRIPFQVRLLEMFSDLTWGHANYLEKICNDTLSYVWHVYEKEADGEISLSEARNELARRYPWIDEEGHAQLRVLGEYYARLKR